jgi:hypothetical protein
MISNASNRELVCAGVKVRSKRRFKDKTFFWYFCSKETVAVGLTKRKYECWGIQENLSPSKRRG